MNSLISGHDGNTKRVVKVSTEGKLETVGTGLGYLASVAITRPANTTAYNGGDVIGIADAGTPANAGSAIHEFTAIGPSGGFIMLTDLDLRVNLSAVPSGMTSFRLHLYNASPDAVLDNAAWDLSSSGDRGKYIGYVDLGTIVDLGSTLFLQSLANNRTLKLADGSTSLFAVLVTTGGYTPGSGTVYTLKARAIAV